MPDPCQRTTTDSELANILPLETVPPVTTRRWNPRRKAQVVRAVQDGMLSEEEACRLYRMTLEELASWQRTLDESGERGLLVTRRVRPRTIDPFDAAWPLQGSVLRNDPHAQSH
jgi:hypothetical protein